MTHDAITLDDVLRINDQELVAALMRLVRADCLLNAELLVHLGEVDARGLYRERACASMFVYCVEVLRMSEAQAYLRIQAARLGRRFPRIVEMFARGTLHLTAIKLLGPHLTAANHVQLLERASGKGKREIELLVASIAPQPDVPNRMRKLAEPNDDVRARRQLSAACASIDAPSKPAHVTPMAAPPAMVAVNSSIEARSAIALETPRPAASSKPLRPGRYKLELTAGRALHDKLVQLQELLRHQVPDGNLAVIVERAVDVLLEQTMKKRFGRTRSPQKRRSAQKRRVRSRYVPRAVVREVHERDAGRCTFVSADGKRCSERGFLELHHHEPFARGGETSVDNLKLVCRAHNALFAERDYGRTFMRSKQTRPSDSAHELAPDHALAVAKQRPDATGRARSLFECETSSARVT